MYRDPPRLVTKLASRPPPAKTKVKQAIKKRLGHEADNLHFVVETNGSISFYENLVEKTPRVTVRTTDLSDKF